MRPVAARWLPVVLILFARPAGGQEVPGLATSIFGVYVSPSQLVAYPAFRRYENRGFDYSPDEFGFPLEQDFRGNYRASQGILFVGYGLSPSLAVGLKASIADARFRKGASDPSAVPQETKESGLEDVSAEVVWRLRGGSGGETELFVLTQILFPHDADKLFLGKDGVAVLPAFGVVRAFSWGTVDARLGLEYDAGSETPFDVGRWSVLGLRGLSESLRLGAGFEGQIGGANSFDEVWLMGHLHWVASPSVTLAVSSTLGVTDLTRGWSPQVGAIVRRPG